MPTPVNKYTPILKGKLGEFKALHALTDQVKDSIIPLIEIPPIPWDFEAEEPAKTPEEHMEKFVPNLAKYWDINRSVFIDLNFIPLETRVNDNHPLSHIFQEARENGLSVIPVTGLERDDEYINAITQIAHEDNQGICIRIENSDIEDENLDQSIITLGERIGVGEANTDIIIDLKVIQSDQIGLLVRSIRDVVRSLPNVNNWRSITLAATSFPQTMSGFDPNSVSLVSRAEWQLWTNLFHNKTKIPRMPNFGDYTVVHPELLDIDPRIMQLGAKIKYTYDNDWIIVKGTSIRRGGSEQTAELCRTLRELTQFQGEDFSWGDRYIQRCANGEESYGNQTTWVTVGVNHHISFVVNQLSNYSVF